MKINAKIFNLPPYISTSWSKISALHMNEDLLVVTLANGDLIKIPGLSPHLIEMIFSYHAAYLEQESNKSFNPLESLKETNPFTQMMMSMEQGMDTPFRFAFGGIDGISSVLEHNQAQSNAPEIPKEILQKIASIAKIVAGDESMAIPKAEPHCNCVHCQISRAIATGMEEQNVKEIHPIEEPVTEADLSFQEWDIQQTGEKMYCVTHRLDRTKKYQVYLGEPLGCTCGEQGCDHILAVLKS